MADPVAWIMIERGWTVRDAGGEEIGRVHEITGDENADIFDGLSIKQRALGTETYVPSEHVAAIREGEVELNVGRDELATLERFTEPPAEERIVPEGSTWLERLTGRLARRDR